MSLVLVFTADFIHSDQPLNYLNRLTVYTVSIDRFTPLYAALRRFTPLYATLRRFMPLYVALRRFTSSLIWQLTQVSAMFVSVLFCFFYFCFLVC